MIDSSIFRNYDIRGEYPTQVNEESVEAAVRAFIILTGARKVLLCSDNRLSSETLKNAALEGLMKQGCEVTDIGLSSTDGMYFATRNYNLEGGIMITASHMPKEFNGIKFMNSKYEPIGKGSGMEELQEIAVNGVYSESFGDGSVTELDPWRDFKDYTLSFVNVENIKPLKVVFDAGNGMGGFVASKVYDELPVEKYELFYELDGSYPNHMPNPILPENRVDLINKVNETGADLGVAWDADCDRVYFVDETGTYVDGDFITLLLGLHFLKEEPGAGIVYDIRASYAVKELIEKAGGKAYGEKIGHTFIKHRMKQEDALFGGEVSGHYYYKSNAYAENGFIAPLIIMEAISTSGKTLSQLIADFGDYYISGEINSTVTSVEDTLKRLEEKYADANSIEYMDGISIDYDDWHFNVRPSSNDPVIRLNLEANSQQLMEDKRDEVLALIRS